MKGFGLPWCPTLLWVRDEGREDVKEGILVAELPGVACGRGDKG